jgi:hypothetical protein
MVHAGSFEPVSERLSSASAGEATYRTYRLLKDRRTLRRSQCQLDHSQLLVELAVAPCYDHSSRSLGHSGVMDFGIVDLNSMSVSVEEGCSFGIPPHGIRICCHWKYSQRWPVVSTHQRHQCRSTECRIEQEVASIGDSLQPGCLYFVPPC